MSRFKLRLEFLILAVIPLILTGCGGEDGGKSKIMSFGISGGIMLFFTAGTCINSMVHLLMSARSQTRGTNSFSRFIRHNTSYGVQKSVIRGCGFVMVFDLIFFAFGFSIPKLLVILLPVPVIVYATILMKKGNEDKQRLRATRDVTKAGVTAGKTAAVVGAAAAGGAMILPVAGAAVGAAGAAGGAALAGASGAGVAGAIGGAAAAGGAGAAAATGAIAANIGTLAAAGGVFAVGHEVAKGSERVRAVMEDVDHGREVREFPELSDGDVISPDEFMKKAMKLGCDSTMSISDMAHTVIKFAPETSLKELPEDMDEVEKAARLLGAVHNTKGIEQKDKVIDAEYREVN